MTEHFIKKYSDECIKTCWSSVTRKSLWMIKYKIIFLVLLRNREGNKYSPTFYMAKGNVSHFGKQFVTFHKIKHAYIMCPCELSPRDINTYYSKNTCMYITLAFVKTAKSWQQSKCTSTNAWASCTYVCQYMQFIANTNYYLIVYKYTTFMTARPFI